MAESKAEQITAAVQAKLAAIVANAGATYWYTPGAVIRAPFFSEACLNTAYITVHVVSPDDEERMGEFTFTDTSARLGLDVLALTQFRPANEGPYGATTPIRETVQHRLARDVKTALRADQTLGGLALNLAVAFVSFAPEETFLSGWACIMARVSVFYVYADAAP